MKIKNFFKKNVIYIVVILEIILFSILSSTFLNSGNILSIFRQVAVQGIVAVGMTFVILTGGVDLSIGGIIALTGVLCSNLMLSGIPIILACLISIIVSSLVGVINAFFTHEFKLNSMIITLATLQILKGITYLWTGGIPVYGFDERFKILGQGYVGPLPIPMIILIISYVVGGYILNKTAFGLKIYSIGGNEEASRLSGTNVRKMRYLSFIICAILTSIAGLVLLSRVNTAQPDAGIGYEMDVITAVVLGGVSMSGGEGNVVGVLGGVLAIGLLSNGMLQLGVSEYVQWITKGIVLLLAVSYDRISKRKKD